MQSKYFPGCPRIADTKTTAEVFGTTPERLANDRYRGRGFPFLRHGNTVRYDLDQVYDFAQQQGNGKRSNKAA